MRTLPDALLAIAARQDLLFTRRQALASGLPASSLDDRVGVSLMRPLPTVYSTFTGELTDRQRLRAAVLFGRMGGAIDVGTLGGLAACHLYGLRTAATVGRIQLLMPHSRQLAGRAFVDVRRTTRPLVSRRLAGLSVCAPALAVVDATRTMKDRDAVRALAAEAVQRQRCTVADLESELNRGGRAGSLLLRQVLVEVGDGVRSAAEAWLRTLVAESGLPQPLWNADLFDTAGQWLARPDALWPEASLAAEVESREWHLSPASWAATMNRTNLLNRLGIQVQQFPPNRIKRAPAAVISELRAAHASGLVRTRANPLQGLVVQPAESSVAS